MTKKDEQADVYPCVEVVLLPHTLRWAIKLRTRPRTRCRIKVYYDRSNAMKFGRGLARDLKIPFRVLKEKCAKALAGKGA